MNLRSVSPCLIGMAGGAMHCGKSNPRMAHAQKTGQTPVLASGINNSPEGTPKRPLLRLGGAGRLHFVAHFVGTLDRIDDAPVGARYLLLDRRRPALLRLALGDPFRFPPGCTPGCTPGGLLPGSCSRSSFPPRGRRSSLFLRHRRSPILLNCAKSIERCSAMRKALRGRSLDSVVLSGWIASRPAC